MSGNGIRSKSLGIRGWLYGIRAGLKLSFGVVGTLGCAPNALLGKQVLRYDKSTMNIKVRNFLRGACSVMDIAPARDLRRLAPRMTTAERMSNHFTRVGESMNRACGAFENNGQVVPHNKKAA